jgi:ribosome-binding protein aMBF1 (putative translation factor)
MPRRSFHEPEAVRQLLNRITAAAAEQGLDEQDLARRAGAAPETLSRMKTRGHGDFGLLVRLARVVGLKLVAVPDDDALEALRRGEFF